MTRPTRDEMLMEIAFTVAGRSTCDRLSVGAVIARSGRVLATGYNGAPAGMAHCDHTCDCTRPGLPFGMKHLDSCAAVKPCNNTIHAEANAIVFAARYGVATEHAELFVTHAPCLICARLIINAGIMGVMYAHDYRDVAGVDLLQSQAIALAKV
jgi:dCMP deaminase